MKYFFDHGEICSKKQTFPWQMSAADPLMQKSFYSIKENKCRFLLLVSFKKIKGLRGNGYWCYSSEVESQFAVNVATLFYMKTDSFQVPPPPQPSNRVDGCRHQVAPIGGKMGSNHDNLWMETTWLAKLLMAVFMFETAAESQLFITFNFPVLALWRATGNSITFITVLLIWNQASCKGG